MAESKQTKTMSRQAKDELSALPTKSCCRRARFSALLKAAGSMHIASVGMRATLTTDDAAVAEFSAAYAFEKYGGSVNIRRGKHITVEFPEEHSMRLLVEAGLFAGEKDGYATVAGIAPFLLKSGCCIREYIRGAFLGCGFLSSDFHHLEFAFNSPEAADALSSLVSANAGRAGRISRGDKHIVYYSGKSNVSDILTYMGATKAALAANDAIVRGDVKRQAVARQNCDLANIDRALKASEEHTRAIEIIDKLYGLENLPDKLQTIALLRQSSPDASISELAAAAGLTKSGLKHRLDKLSELAAKLSLTDEEKDKE